MKKTKIKINNEWQNRVKNNLGLSALSKEELERYKQIRVTNWYNGLISAKIGVILVVIVLMLELINALYGTRFNFLDSFLSGFFFLALIIFLLFNRNPESTIEKNIKKRLEQEKKVLNE